MTHRDREEFLAILAKEMTSATTGEVLYVGRRLMFWAGVHKRLAEKDCNDGLTEAERRKEGLVEERIRGLCEPYDITPVFSGDPRGATVKLKVPSGRTNDFGNTGVVVPQ